MSRGPAKYDRGTSRNAGGNITTRRTAVFAFTDGQRKAVQKFRNAARDENTATKALAIAVMQEQVACAQMYLAGLKIERIMEITMFKRDKVRTYIDHGRALIEDVEIPS